MRRIQTVVCGLVWLVAMLAPARLSAQASSRYSYYYYDRPVALSLDAQRIAVFQPADATLNVAADRLIAYGIAARDVAPTAVRGLAFAQTPAGSADDAGVRALVRTLATNREADFVSPVFLDPRGGPIVMTRDLIVGFVATAPPERAEQTLLNWTGGRVLDRDWLGMKGVYRVRCMSRDGFEVLAIANRLARRSNVRFAEPDMILRAYSAVIPSDPLFAQQWALNNTGQTGGTVDVDIDAPEAWDVTTGAPSVTVVILDDGVQQDHPDLTQIPGRDFTGQGIGGGPGNACDRHGTAVAGCVSAAIDNGIGVVGVAPGCTVASAKWKIADVPCTGFGIFQESWLVSAIAWSQTIGARVTNNSNFINVSLPAVTEVYNQTRAAGIVHFAAAGNGATNQIDYPASLPVVYAVSALDHYGAPATFTNTGVGMAFSAPGVSILTTDRTGADGYDVGDSITLDGTSFASPYVAGVAALVISIDPTQTVAEIDAILRNAVVDLGTGGLDSTYGWGLIKAGAAVSVPQAPNTTCEAAHPVDCNGVAAFANTTSNEAPAPAPSCGSGEQHAGALWFTFTAASTSARIDTCASGAVDTTLAVYEGACGKLVEIACAEEGDCESSADRAAACVTGLTIGETYHVQVSSRTPQTRGQIQLRITCSCPAACCLLPPLAPCLDLKEDECASLAGVSALPGSRCLGDGDASGFDDACESVVVDMDQPPQDGESGVASNLDWIDRTPNRVAAEDYVSSGFPTRTVRWWGSDLGRGIDPDGWMISFHEIPTPDGPVSAPLGLYFCAFESVGVEPASLTACDGYGVSEYTVRLGDCCLMQSAPDSRVKSDESPAQPQAFFEEVCLSYRLAIQAVIGRRFDDDGSGGCSEMATGRNVSGDFWGWQTANDDGSVGPAMESGAFPSAGEWFYLPWGPAALSCGSSGLSMRVESTQSVTEQRFGVWSNGVPGDVEALNSQNGGEFVDAMTVDDFVLAEDRTITEVTWTNEEEGGFAWSGRVRLEFYPEDGDGAPDASNGPAAALWIPDDGGSVARSYVGPGRYHDRYAYAIRNIDVPLSAGGWWIGVATAAEAQTEGIALWVASHVTPGDESLFGAEARFRSPSFQINDFRPWSEVLARPPQHDMNFALRSVPTADCNCNGAPDLEDIVDIDETATYVITVEDLVGLPTSCGGGSVYNACTKRDPGFQWTDTGRGVAASVEVEFNVGVECHAIGTQHQTQLNGVDAATYASEHRHCACTTTRGVLFSTIADPASYVVGGVNTFAVADASTCLGLVPKEEWGEGVYGRVTVVYHGASQDCNANAVPDECDIAGGDSVDLIGVNGASDGVPDECQTDCNANGLADDVDIAEGDSVDVVGPGAAPDGIPDECQSDCTGNLIPDYLDIEAGKSPDCNDNASPDDCDIADGTSADTFGVGGGDGIPDECQLDCNRNDLPDDYEVKQGLVEDCNGNGIPDGCDLSRQHSADCQPNGVPDECDIAFGAANDFNENGVPDECECDTESVEAAPTAPSMARYLAVSPGDVGQATAIRIRSVTLHDPVPPNAPQFPPPDFSALEGREMWVGVAAQVTDSVSNQSALLVAPTTCEPHCMDYGSFGVLYVYGADIVPSSTYEVQAIRCECDLDDESSYSAGLMVSTGRWGDVTMPYATAEGSSQPDFGDIAALVEKFQDGVGAVTKSQAQLQPNIVDPTAPVDFRDIAADIDAFTGTAYPYTGPCVCPSTVLCGAAACDTEVDCADGGRCVDGFCTDACGRCTQ